MQMVLDVGAENNRTSSVSTVQPTAHHDDDDDNEADDVVDIYIMMKCVYVCLSRFCLFCPPPAKLTIYI